MNRSAVREFHAGGIDVRAGEVLVPTLIGDPDGGSLSCPAAPLLAGSLQRKGRTVRFAPVPQFRDPRYEGDQDGGVAGAVLFAAVCQQYAGGTVVLAAGAAPADRLAAAAARAAVEEWAAVLGTRRLLLAASPWCGGARRALEAADRALAGAGGRTVHIYGRLAASAQAAADLAGRGAVFGAELADMAGGDIIVLAAHGVPPQVRAQAAERGLTVVDATCPLVAAAQAQAAKLAVRGDHVVVIGQPEHPAATAIAGHGGPAATVVATSAEAATLRARDARRVSYLLAPGLPVEDSAPVAAGLRSRFPAVRGPHPDGFCYAASDRADSIRAIAAGADLVLIAGEPASADARQLAGLARDRGTRAVVVARAGDISPAMLAGTSSVGIAESTSASPGLAAEVLSALSGLGPVSVVRRQVTTTIDGQPAVMAPAGADGLSA